jgi:hypothetical protein
MLTKDIRTISRTSHTQVEMSHTQYEPLTHKSKCHTQKSRISFVESEVDEVISPNNRRQRRWRVGMNGIVVISSSSRQAKSMVIS